MTAIKSITTKIAFFCSCSLLATTFPVGAFSPPLFYQQQGSRISTSGAPLFVSTSVHPENSPLNKRWKVKQQGSKVSRPANKKRRIAKIQIVPSSAAISAPRTTMRRTSKTTDSQSTDDTQAESIQSASIAGTTFNIMKCMLGSGCLALSSGLAAVSDHKSMVAPANLLLVALAALSAYTFALYGKLCHATNAKSLGDIWKKVYKSNDSTPISLASFSFCYGACLIFLLIIGDTMSSLVQAALMSGSSPAWTGGWMASRQTIILSVMGTLLIPLCSLKSLAALAPVSIVGVLASVVSSLFVVLRCPHVLASSPYQWGTPGTCLASLPAKYLPQFGSYCRAFGPAPLVLFGMGGMALMAHFSAPEFYQALAGSNKKISNKKMVHHDQHQSQNKLMQTSETSNYATLRKYMKATLLSFVSVGIVNALTLSCGFLTFGQNSQGMILNNYATQDIGAALSRMLVAVSMIGGFPLLFMALRSAADDLFGKRDTGVVDNNSSQPARKSWKMKWGLLSSLTAISMVVKDAGFVVGLNGAVMGSAIIYLFPALMFLRLTLPESEAHRGERLFSRALVGFGVVSALVGGATTVMNTYFPHLLG